MLDSQVSDRLLIFIARRKAERRHLLKAHEMGAHLEARHPKCPGCKAETHGQENPSQKEDGDAA